MPENPTLTNSEPKTIQQWLPKSTSPTPAQIDILKALASKHNITYKRALSVFKLQLEKGDA